jgi:hypothetical protein
VAAHGASTASSWLPFAARRHLSPKIPLLSRKYEPTGNAFAARAGLMNKGP